MKRLILPLLIAGSVFADDPPSHAPMKVKGILHAGLTRDEVSIVQKYNGLFMNVSKATPTKIRYLYLSTLPAHIFFAHCQLFNRCITIWVIYPAT